MSKFEYYRDDVVNEMINKVNQFSNTPVGNPLAEERLKMELENHIKEKAIQLYDFGFQAGKLSTRTVNNIKHSVARYKTILQMRSELRKEILRDLMKELNLSEVISIKKFEKKYAKKYDDKVEKKLEQQNI